MIIRWPDWGIKTDLEIFNYVLLLAVWITHMLKRSSSQFQKVYLFRESVPCIIYEQ